MRASDIRKGTAVIYDGTLYIVTEADHSTPGNLRARVQFKLRDVAKNTIIDRRVGATDDIEVVSLDKRNAEYLYSDDTGHIFMDLETYDQNPLPKDLLGTDILFLKPNTPIMVLVHDGKVVSYELPNTVDMTVTDTTPAIKGATATNQQKEATLETGLNVRVPPFIEMGEKIRVSTDGGNYLSRVND